MQKRSLKQKCLAWVLSLAVAMTFIPMTAGIAFADPVEPDYFINLDKANEKATGNDVTTTVNLKAPWQDGDSIKNVQFYTGEEMKPELDNIRCKMGVGSFAPDAVDDQGRPFFTVVYNDEDNWTDEGDYEFKIVANPEADPIPFTFQNEQHYAKFIGEYKLTCSITNPKNLNSSTVTFSEGTVNNKTGAIEIPYDGKLHKLVPEKVETADGVELVQDVDYEVTYPNTSTNAYRKVGEFDIVITAKDGNAGGYFGNIKKVVSITDTVTDITVFSQKGINGTRSQAKVFKYAKWGEFALSNPIKWGYDGSSGEVRSESTFYIPIETLFAEAGLSVGDEKDMIDLWTNSEPEHYFNAPQTVADLQKYKYTTDGQEVLNVFGGEFTIPAFLVLDCDNSSANPRAAVGSQTDDSSLPRGNMSASAVSEIALVSMDINGLKTTVKNATYTGKALKPAVTVKDGDVNVPVTVAYSNNTKAGKGTAKITAKADSDYYGTVTKTFTIAKAANTLTVKAKAAKVKKSKVKKKAQKIAAKKVMTVSKAQGKVTYAKVSGNKKLTIAKNGTVTVKKKTKKGTYKMKVKVTAAGNANYNAGSKVVTVQVKVK